MEDENKDAHLEPPTDGGPEDPQDPGDQIIDPKDPLKTRFLVDLPEIINVTSWSKVGEIKTTWKKGIREIESVFQDHMSRICDMFEEKGMEYERIRNQLIINHDFLNRYYLDMQRDLNEKYLAIQKERDAWEKEKAEIKGMINLDSEVVSLNVGGTHHLKTERDVLRLCKGSTLEKMFNGMHDLKKIDDSVFLDRDGKTFQYLVNYLRNDRTVFPEFMDKNDEIHFFKELDFWKVPVRPGTKSASQVYNAQNYPTQKMNTSFGSSGKKQARTPIAHDYDAAHSDKESHGVALKAAKDKWNELGPLKLEDIVANSNEPIDQTMAFGQSKYNQYIIGQLGGNGKVSGVGKEINHIIYEGQFKDDVYNGFGRFIYSNGNYYIGNWLDGKRSG